jgi:hypothetical protein
MIELTASTICMHSYQKCSTQGCKNDEYQQRKIYAAKEYATSVTARTNLLVVAQHQLH